MNASLWILSHSNVSNNRIEFNCLWQNDTNYLTYGQNNGLGIQERWQINSHGIFSYRTYQVQAHTNCSLKLFAKILVSHISYAFGEDFGVTLCESPIYRLQCRENSEENCMLLNWLGFLQFVSFGYPWVENSELTTILDFRKQVANFSGVSCKWKKFYSNLKSRMRSTVLRWESTHLQYPDSHASARYGRKFKRRTFQEFRKYKFAIFSVNCLLSVSCLCLSFDNCKQSVQDTTTWMINIGFNVKCIGNIEWVS